jgi:transposase
VSSLRNRQANSAIYRIMLVRMASDDATRAYITRRTSEGKTMGEIARMLKRYIAREVYKTLPTIIS